MTIKPVSKGGRVQEALSADTWNAFVRAANAHDLRSDISQGRPASANEKPYSTVKVNCGIAQVARREVVGLTTPGITPSSGQQTFDTRLLFDQQAPAQGQFGLAEAAGGQNVFNPFIAAGIVQCKLFVPANGGKLERADIDPSDATRLLSTPNGSAQILWKDAGTDTTVDAIVRLGNQEYVEVAGKLNNPASAPATPGSSNNVVRVWGLGVDTGYDITDVHLDWMTGNENISHDKEVFVGWFPAEKRWRFVGAECETTGKERAVGQLQDDADALVPQALTTTPVPWNNFAASENLATPNVTLNAAAATIQLPDVTDPNGDVYTYSYTGILTPGSNNNTYSVEATINGSLTGFPLLIDGRQSGTSLSFSFAGKVVIPTGSAPVIGLTIAMDSGTDTINWNGGLFMMDRDTDF